MSNDGMSITPAVILFSSAPVPYVNGQTGKAPAIFVAMAMRASGSFAHAAIAL
jgi:hypothetical protein